MAAFVRQWPRYIQLMGDQRPLKITRIVRQGAGREAEERTVAETWQRMAIAHAAPEPDDRRACWADRFLEIPQDFKVLPGGQIQAGVGQSAMSASSTAS